MKTKLIKLKRDKANLLQNQKEHSTFEHHQFNLTDSRVPPNTTKQMFFF
jgi:hypothetical protein